MGSNTCQLGMVGLGVMGRNLLLNLADHGFAVAGYDRDPQRVADLRKEGAGKPVEGVGDLQTLLERLSRPCTVMMLVPAGPPVDAVIRDLLPHLQPADLVVDGGNSHFKDTDLRAKTLEEKGLFYLGVGISGGESGARHGASIMPGGPEAAYRRVAPLLKAAAADVGGEPCVAHLGPGSAGHYVKMVHNGIEYGLMQLLGEAYDLMKRGLDLDDGALGKVFQQWNQAELSGYLVEITSHIFSQTDPASHRQLIDVILDEAKQKGTGMWASQDAMDLQVPTPTIDLAVAMRSLSALKEEREAAAELLARPTGQFQGDPQVFVDQLKRAVYAAMIVTFAQGMAQLRRASEVYGYDLHLDEVARIWRGGCIIRQALLEDIRAAYRDRPQLPNLLLDPRLAGAVLQREEDWRYMVRAAAEAGIPVPGLMVSLGYLDSFRSRWLPANLIQAQRDYFGAHTYERVDAKGMFHTHWAKPEDAAYASPSPAEAGG
jgi:6-phosphogluconate dehydrogenase